MTSQPSAAPPSDPSEGSHLDEVTAAVRVKIRAPGSALAAWVHTFTGPSDQAQILRDAEQVAPEAAERLLMAATKVAQVGAEIAGFRLLSELGQGAFGRVFLAQQADLADREVVLKVSPTVEVESRILARLHHPNIVPIYSIHRAGLLQAVCMPYFGATTLAHVMKDLADSPALPQSGDALMGTVHARRSTLASGPASWHARSHSPAAAPQADGAPAPSAATGPKAAFQSLSYVDAVLWIGAQIAAGLAHAHERGVIHRDLKPQNVLLTDDGTPMLLDFNLAQDTQQHGAAFAHVGGTLPFMAPEHLDALRRDEPLLDPCGDVYSLGVLLFELFTGRHPFEHHTGEVKELLPKMIQERQGPPPSLRRWNRAISPAAEAIIRRCLEPNPADRYPSAQDLKEDLERQLKSLPLRHTPEPSLRERASKFVRRHPRLTSMTTLGCVAAVLLIGLFSLLLVRNKQVADLEARAKLARFLDDRKTAQYLLTARTDDARSRDAGVRLGRELLGRYGVLDRRRWRQTGPAGRLSGADRQALDAAVGELLLLLSRGVTAQAAALPDGPERQSLLAEALRLNELAEADGEEESRALWLQRAEIFRLLGRPDDAKRMHERAEATPLRTATDRYLVAAELLSKGRHQQALPLLHDATARHPQDFWCWFLLGVCYDGLAQHADAIACYSTCLAIAPDSPWAHYNRGLARLRLGRYAPAAADLDRAIELCPTLVEAYTNRAVARLALRQYREAIQDLDRALELGAAPTYVLFLRADAKQRAGDGDGAKKDREEALRTDPIDEMGWLARGYARIHSDPKAALADFDEALKLNPRSLNALQNKAHVLSKLGKNEQALAVLDVAVELYPDFVPARAGRGVIRARLGKRALAHEDAEGCLAQDKAALTQYQVAGIYALTSKATPADRPQAFRLLGAALQRGCGFDLLENDRDLDPIRNCPEFRKLADAARAIRATPAPDKR
jgi:serine/threonine protein kinase/Tfp pilus assembly protein PilF